jgi:hypothetical protein
MSESKSILKPEQIGKVQGQIQLILLAISALGIKDTSKIIMPNNEGELQETITKIISLVQKNQELIRRACALVEEIKQQNKSLDSYGIVKDYWQNFQGDYHHQIPVQTSISSLEMEQLAIKILFELLFYTGVMGKSRLQEQLNSLK